MCERPECGHMAMTGKYRGLRCRYIPAPASQGLPSGDRTDLHTYRRRLDVPRTTSSDMSPWLAYASVVLLWLGNAVATDNETDRMYDVVIVGGGAAGCALAAKLSEVKDWRVLLLEAGPEEPEWSQVPAYSSYTLDPVGNIDWGLRTEPSPSSCGGVGCEFPRGKTLGGSTASNGMFYVRGSRHDYNHWGRMGNPGWNYEEALKYFVLAERNHDPLLAATKYHGADGQLDVGTFKVQDENAQAVMSAILEADLNLTERDLNGRYLIGAAVTQMTARDGVRRSANQAFLRPARGRPNLHVFTGAHVARVLFQNLTHVYGVEYIKDGRTQQVFATKEVILCAGSIMSPQILQLSGVGPAEVLQPLGIDVIADLAVGENLQDHPCSVAIVAKVTRTPKMPNITEHYRDFTDYIHEHKGPLTSTGTLQIAAFFYPENSSDDDDVPYMEMTFAPTSTQGSLPFCYYDRVYFVPILQKPLSKGYVRVNSTDPLQPPLIQPNYFVERQDMDRMVEGARYGLKILNTSVLRDIGFEPDTEPVPGCEDLLWGSDEYLRCAINMTTRSNYHPVTTCKMGPRSDNTTVVDSELRVHGLTGLRVCDASIMPTLISGHTMAPAIMVGHKCADLLKATWGSSSG